MDEREERPAGAARAPRRDAWREAAELVPLPDHILEAIRLAPPLSPANAAIARGILWGISAPAEAPELETAA